MIILYLIVAAATGYFAGIYHNRALMVLFVAELLLAAVLLALSIMFRAALSAGFDHRNEHTRYGRKYVCGIHIRKKWILPVSRFRFFYLAEPVRDASGAQKRIGKRGLGRSRKSTGKRGLNHSQERSENGSLRDSGNSSVDHDEKHSRENSVSNRRNRSRNNRGRRHTGEDWQMIYGGIDSASLILTVPVSTDFLGFVRCRIRNLQVWDYLKLFRMTRKFEDQMILTILPEELPLHISLSSDEMSSDYSEEIPYNSMGGEDHSEIRQIREYRPEDSMRHIHWKQSARLDRIMVREYEHEQNPTATLYLESDDIKNVSKNQQDSFYQLIYSAMLGLTEDGIEIHLTWKDKDTRNHSRIIRSPGECDEMMPIFYQWTADLSGEEMRFSGMGEGAPFEDPEDQQDFSDYFKIDSDLCLWHSDQMLYRFPAEYDRLLREIRAFGDV